MSITTTEYQFAYGAGFSQTVRSLLLHGLSKAEAEDVAQAAWVRGWAKRDTLREPASAGGWINMIALNIFRTNYRRDRKRRPLTAHGIAAKQERFVTRIDVQRALLRCSPEDRVLLEDLYVYGYSSEETARRRALTPGAVRVRAFRAKQRLRERLGERFRPRSLAED
jgi:RNA polymerase sigma-70 factor (ECF subfamily)